MRINHNIAALNTHRQLNSATTAQSKSMEKLASGLRINKAGDDAAGLAISEKMRGQIRGLDQASKNAQDGISMIATAEGALNETHDILQRMRELAVQSSNDTSTEDDRNKIQEEMNQLTSEINRIGNTTEFNTQKLLDGGGVKSTTAITTPTVSGARAGAVSVVSENTTSETGKATVTNDGFTVTANQIGTEQNGKTITFATGGTGDDVSVVTSGNNITVTVSADLTNLSFVNTALADQGSLPKGFTVSDAAGTGSIVGDALNGLVFNPTGGGETETTGNYSFDINSAFVTTGDTFKLELGNGKAVTLTAGTNFSITDTKEKQAADIADILRADTTNFFDDYDVKTVGSKLVITEREGLATGVKPTITAVTTAAVAGDYDLTVTDASKVDVGGKYTIDGQDIKVTDDATDAGLARGTAILAGTTAEEQAENLKTAVELNTTLNVKYDVAASTGATLNLKQAIGHESSKAPEVSTSDTTKTGFEASFQIGANTGQSMTIQVDDMRSAALGISGNTENGTVTADNGKVASYVATKNVTDGSTNENSEFALDISSHEKASAAISVINDAINTVSAERSKLGANQNRLEHTINNLGTSSENLTAAESRIRDVDMAKEMMEQTKNSILAQASQAMLAQANQLPQGVLQLLR